MSQRNPMNDRYQTDKVKGQTKKSAAQAKPKSKAAASVYVRSSKPTPQEKKAIRKQERAKAAERDRMFYNPPTKRYKDLRRLWWILLISAIVLTVVSFFGQQYMSPTLTMVTLIAAYACIIAALYVDFSKIRKERRRYQAEMMKKHPKAIKQAEKAAVEEMQQRQEEKEEKKKGGFMSRFKKDKSETSSEEASETNEAGKAGKKEEQVVPDHARPIAEVKAEHDARKAEKKESEQ